MSLQLTDLASLRLYSFAQEVVSLGRHSLNDIVIQHQNVSRQHCCISRKGGLFFLEDLASEEGTFVQATDFHQLSPEDVVQVGLSQLKFSFQDQHSLSLLVLEGPHQGEQHRLAFQSAFGVFSLGRAGSCAVRLQKDVEVGSVHARLLRIDGRFYLENLHLKKGLWVKLHKKQQLKGEMVLRVHQSVFRLAVQQCS